MSPRLRTLLWQVWAVLPAGALRDAIRVELETNAGREARTAKGDAFFAKMRAVEAEMDSTAFAGRVTPGRRAELKAQACAVGDGLAVSPPRREREATPEPKCPTCGDMGRVPDTSLSYRVWQVCSVCGPRGVKPPHSRSDKERAK